jgi:hypothetical protein
MTAVAAMIAIDILLIFMNSCGINYCLLLVVTR